MKNKRVFKILSLVMILSLGLLTACGGGEKKAGEDGASDFPKKPVEVVVGFGAGGETDMAARLIFQYAEKYFDNNFAIINKTGAQGEIAWTEVANAEPDGYTIAFINPPTFASHPAERGEKCGYAIDDFDIIANMVTDPACFVVAADSEINTVEELYEKAKNNDVSIGYSGPGTSEDMTLDELAELTGTDLERIPYDGSAPSIVALMSGDIESAILNVSGALAHSEDGTVKVIGITDSNRAKDYPDVSTLEEQGLPVYNTAYRGLAAPKGVPADRLEKIEEAVEKALEDEEFQKRAKEIGLPIDYKNSEEFTEVINKLYENLLKGFSK